MKIYFDTEFTGLHKDTTLISIGLIAESGESFYAELKDYDKGQVNDWIENNVLKNLWHFDDTDSYTSINEDDEFYVYGDTAKVRQELIHWLQSFNTYIELVSDVCHYDMVLFINLFGSAFDLPKFISPVCYDINQDIARFLTLTEGEAFDKSRKSLLDDFGIEILGKKHNSLYDAKVIKCIYELINNY